MIDLDFAILNFLNQYFFSDLAYLFLFITNSVYVFLVLFLCYFFVKKQRPKAVQLILAFIIGYLLILSLKYSIGRPRPHQTHPEINRIIEKADPSFPSSHAFFSLLCFSFVPKNFRKYIYLFFVYLAVLIPFGLMYIGVHYFSDVIAGAFIGLLMPRIISEKFSVKLVKKLSF
jgi:undecaprenyl-diphosphatase